MRLKKTPLQEKYGKYSMVKYRTIAAAPKKGRAMVCSLCGHSYVCNVEPDVAEIICNLCISGLADAIETHKENYVDLEKLLENVKEGRLEKFRSTNGLTRADLGRYLHVSPKYLQRIENLQNYPIDRLVKAIKKKMVTVHSA